MSIPVLRWINHRAGYSAADLGDGTTLRIIPVTQFSLELWHYKRPGEQPVYLGTHIGLDEARAAARTWVGDDESTRKESR